MANTSDVEGGSFHMTSILDYKVNTFSDVASFIEGSIHVIDGDGDGEVLDM